LFGQLRQLFSQKRVDLVDFVEAFTMAVCQARHPDRKVGWDETLGRPLVGFKVVGHVTDPAREVRLESVQRTMPHAAMGDTIGMAVHLVYDHLLLDWIRMGQVSATGNGRR
jgi:hypothetical protein